MDDQSNRPKDTSADDSDNPTTAAPNTDESFGWTANDPGTGSHEATGTSAERMVSQLQSMIDSIATQAAPVVRQVGIKAAELAAAAADRAGPIAQKAADATADASVKIAERSRVLAADLRRDGDGRTGTATAERETDIAEELREETARGEGDESGAINSVLEDATESGHKPG